MPCLSIQGPNPTKPQMNGKLGGELMIKLWVRNFTKSVRYLKLVEQVSTV